MRRLLGLMALLLISLRAFATSEVCPECIHATGVPPAFSQAEILQRLAELELTCPEPGTLELEEAKKAYSEYFPASAPRLSKVVRGALLSGSPEELAITERILDGIPPSSWPAVLSSCDKNPGHDLRCALGAVFGSEESALRALVIGKRSGYIVSLSQEENAKGIEQIWRKEEVRAIDRALQSLPARFHNLKTFERFLRVHDDYIYCEKTTSSGQCTPGAERPEVAALAYSGYARGSSFARGRIVAYAAAFRNGQNHSESVIVHELAHQLDFSTLEDSRDPLRKTLGFEKMSWDQDLSSARDTMALRAKPSACFASNYGATNSAEDFATAIEKFVTTPGDFQAKCPEKYDFVKNTLFGGKEPNPGAWPPFTRALEKADARADALLTFGKCPKYIGPSSTGAAALVWEPKPNETHLLRGYDPKNFWRASDCLSSVAKKLITGMNQAEREQACLLGPDALQRALSHEIKPLVEPFLDLAFAFHANPPSLACAPPKGDPSRECFWSAHAKAKLEANPALKALPTSRLEEISGELYRLLYADPFRTKKR